MQQRPLIGVTGPDKGGEVAWLMTALALKRCGAKARRITPKHTADEASLSGIVIGGGSDVDPLHYGEEPIPDTPRLVRKHQRLFRQLADTAISILLTALRIIFSRPTPQAYDPERDQLEQQLIRYALYYDKPILGICRGAQLMNVTLGGSLHQSISHFYMESTNIRTILPGKTVKIDPASHLYRVLEKQVCVVNALHDQSINRPGEQLQLCAVEANGVVQAIEQPEHCFFIGVQWHPEYMPQSRTQQKLFRGLVAAARQQHTTSHNSIGINGDAGRPTV